MFASTLVIFLLKVPLGRAIPTPGLTR